MTENDFEWFWRELAIPPENAGSAGVCRLILTRAGNDASTNHFAERLLELWRDDPLLTHTQVMVSLAKLVPASALPTLLFTPPVVGDATVWLEETGYLMAQLVAAVPALPAALVAETSTVEALFKRMFPTHTFTLLREGLVPVQSLGESELAERLRSVGAVAEVCGTAQRLAKDGVSEELAADFAEAARHVRAPTNREDEDAARSAAERFLFERLETLSATTGLFALNLSLDFHHGPRLAEVDLYAASLRLVIELDGSYFHLHDSVAYRRDRRKDWELQRRGYLVLRFLSEDVVVRLEEILDTILAAVELRRSSPERGQLA